MLDWNLNGDIFSVNFDTEKSLLMKKLIFSVWLWHLVPFVAIFVDLKKLFQYCQIGVETAICIPECIPFFKNLYENSKIIHEQEKTMREKDPPFLIKKISDTHQYEIARKGNFE